MAKPNPLDRLVRLRDDVLAGARPATSDRSGGPTLDASNMDTVLRKLTELDAKERARKPEPPPGEELRDLMDGGGRHDAARRVFDERAARLRQIEGAAGAVAQELLPPLSAVSAEGPLEKDVEILRLLQLQVLRHPVAFRSAFVALVAEGRRFAETAEGAVWADWIRGSPLLPDVKLMLKMVSLSMLDENDPEALPSTYLDALFRVITEDETDAVLNRLFGGRTDAGTAD